MIGFLAPGTKENVHVEFVDRTGIVTTLVGSGPSFTVKDEAGADKVTDVTSGVSVSGMRITLLLDTTVGGVWDEGEYRLFVKFTVGSQVVVKGPYYFTLTET